MSNFRATPTITRSWTSYVLASVSAAVALNMAFLPLGTAAANARAVRSVTADGAAPLRTATAMGAVAPTVAGTDHSVIAPDAVSVGDVETVEMSIAAYER